MLEETLTLVQHPFKTAQVNMVRNYSGPVAGYFRFDHAAAAGISESFHERARRHARRRMLEVRTGSRNGSVEVEVTDTGARHFGGALASNFRSVFHHESHRQRTGLGLSVSYGSSKSMPVK